MAVTFNQQPVNYQMSDNPLIYVFSSTQTGQANFSYIVETYINAVKVSTERIFPERSGRGHWDASLVVKTAIYTPTRPTLLYQDINLPAINVKVIENYGATPVNQASATSNTVVTIKGKFSEEDFKTYDIAIDWVNLKWLTEIPDNIIHATKTQDVFAQFICTNISQILRIDAFDIDGNYLNSYSSTSEFLALWNCNFSYSNILAVLPEVVDAYELQIFINASETLFVRYDIPECSNKDVLSWVNKFGAFDQFVFTHFREDRGATESQSFQRQFGGWNGANWSFDNEYGEIETVKMTKPTGYIVSGWLDKITQNWLVTIYQAIGVKLNTTQTIKITSSSYVLKTQRFEELINEEITYQLTGTKSIMI